MKILRSLTTIGCLLLMVAFLIHNNLKTEEATASALSDEVAQQISGEASSLPSESGPMPDLVIESFTLQPTTPLVGEPVIATIRVRNQGDASGSGGFRTYLYIEPDDQPPTTETEDTHNWGYFVMFPPDETTGYESEGYTFTESGCNHKIYAWVDRDNKMDESDESNNLSELQICVSPPDDSGDEDIYEPDDDYKQASEIPTDGTAQTHYFRPDGDVDWVKFYGNAGETYLIQAAGTGEDSWPEFEIRQITLGGISRLEFTAPVTDWYYLRLENKLEPYNPDESDYRLTVLGENQTEQGVAPTLSSIDPNEGTNDENTNVTITGADFHVTPLVELCPYSNGTCQLGTVDNPTCDQLLDTSWATSQDLFAIVPANLDIIGPYCLVATNPGGGQDVLPDTFTVLSGDPELVRVLPNQSYNDLPNDISVYGFNFADGITVRLNGPDNTALSNVTIVNRTHLRGTVPADLTEGSYDLEAFYELDEVATLSDAYTILQAAQGDDLFGQADELWVDPVAPHAGAVTKLALRVHRQGGEATLSDVPVRFSVNGSVIGNATISLLGPDSEENTSQIEWTPPDEGNYQITAEIDPNGQFTESSETNNTIIKTVTVLAQAPDAQAPHVDSLLINGGQETVTDTQVSLTASATDLQGGTGVKKVRYIELEYSEGSRVWIPVQNSDWLDYATSNENYSWTLSPVSGIHYIQGWAKDENGNISTFPNQQSINHIPPTGQLERNQTRVYRQYLTTGETLQVNLIRISGDPDLYIWPPNWQQGNPPWVSNQAGDSNETLTIQAPVSGEYQVEVYGFAAAEFQLTIETSRLALESSPSDCSKGRECRTEPAIPLGSQPPRNISDDTTPTPTPTPTPTTTSFSLYLPSIIR